MPDTSHAGAVSVDERRVSTPHGSIFVREAPGDGPAVVLMHGFPDDQRIYARLLPLLSPRRAVTFDFLGYGRSDRSATAGFTPDDHAAQITAVLDALDIPDAVLVGHDASGPDAVCYKRTTAAGSEKTANQPGQAGGTNANRAASANCVDSCRLGSARWSGCT